MSQRPTIGPPSPDGTDEEVDRNRGVIVTVVTVVLAIIILVALPSHASSSASSGSTTSTTTTTVAGGHSGTTVPTGSGSTTTTTVAGSATKVALLAPAGAPTQASVKSKLEDAHFDVVKEVTIPASWVSSLTSPFVRYPEGYTAEALKVGVALGVPVSDVQAELPGGGYGADVIEVFVPA